MRSRHDVRKGVVRSFGGPKTRACVAAILAAFGVGGGETARGAGALGPDSSAIVTARVVVPSVPAHIDSTYTIDLVITIRKGWHINSPVPVDENLIGTAVRIEPLPGIDSASVQYPAPRELELAFADTPVPVYDGSVTIPLTLYPATGLKPGTYALPGEFTYQACNATVCLQPATLHFSIPLTVVAAVSRPPHNRGNPDNTTDRKH